MFSLPNLVKHVLEEQRANCSDSLVLLMKEESAVLLGRFVSTRFHFISTSKDMGDQFPALGQALMAATWVLPGVHHGLLSDGWGHRKTPLRLRQLWQRVWQEELPSRRGPSFGAGHDPKKVSFQVSPQPTEGLDFKTLYQLVV